ncbi:hypothetical protein, partial [Komagataeibacter kakiaceti]|uniref:hypothetical protein n=1 Tax=Komagataeibacter kakiaceti TaxID=943261 RepID=UPI001F58C1D0
MVLPLEGQGRILGYLFTGLGDAPVGRMDQPGHDERLRPGAGFHQPPVHQHLIDATFCHARCLSSRTERCVRPSAANAVRQGRTARWRQW